MQPQSDFYYKITTWAGRGKTKQEASNVQKLSIYYLVYHSLQFLARKIL